MSNPRTESLEDAPSFGDPDIDFALGQNKLVRELNDNNLGNMMTDLWNGSLKRLEQEALVIQALNFVMQRDSELNGEEVATPSAGHPSLTHPVATSGMFIHRPLGWHD